MAFGVVPLLLLFACGAPPQVDKGVPILRIAGSDTLIERLLPQLANAHQESVGNIDFHLQDGGPSQGFKQLLAGDVDVAATARVHTPAEQDQASAAGFSLDAPGARQIVAVNVVAVVVHPQNALDSLTYDQVIGIFCNGSVDNWAFLGEDDSPIHAVAPAASSGTRMVFEDFFCGPKGLSPHVQIESSADIRKSLEQDPASVSFVSLAEQTGKVLGLRPEVDGHPVLPSQQNVIRGVYPLYNDLYLYTRGPAKGTAKQFFDWIASPAGQEVVDEQRFVPLFLRPPRMDSPRPLRETIHFEANSKVPDQRSLARLQLLVDELKDRADEARTVSLDGYCDSTEANPTQLSEQRAIAVRELLARQLPGTEFEIIPRGSDHPLAPNQTPYGREENRRVLVYLGAEEAPMDTPRSAGG